MCLVSFFKSGFFNSLFSFNLALLSDAILLDLEPISSSLSALDSVSLVSLLFVLSFLLFISLGTTSPLSLLVALCSANFLLSKSDLIFF